MKLTNKKGRPLIACRSAVFSETTSLRLTPELRQALDAKLVLEAQHNPFATKAGIIRRAIARELGLISKDSLVSLKYE